MANITAYLWDGNDTTDIVGERIYNAVAETIALKSSSVTPANSTESYHFETDFVGDFAIGSPTIVGTPTIVSSPVKVGIGAAEFNGDGCVKYGTRVMNAVGVDYSLEGWARSGRSTEQAIVSEFSSSAVGTSGLFVIEFTPDGTFYFIIREAGTAANRVNLWATAVGAVPVNTYFHYAVTFDESTGVTVIKINDVDVTPVKQNNLVFSGFAVTAQTVLGALLRTGDIVDLPLNGYQDELSFYRGHILSNAEITAAYNGGAGRRGDYPTDSPSPVAIWTATELGTINMSTFRVPENNNDGDAGTIKYQYAFNGDALNGTWLTQAQMQALGNAIPITNSVESIKFVAQYTSDGTQKTTTRAFATVDVTFVVISNGGSKTKYHKVFGSQLGGFK